MYTTARQKQSQRGVQTETSLQRAALSHTADAANTPCFQRSDSLQPRRHPGRPKFADASRPVTKACRQRQASELILQPQIDRTHLQLALARSGSVVTGAQVIQIQAQCHGIVEPVTRAHTQPEVDLVRLNPVRLDAAFAPLLRSLPACSLPTSSNRSPNGRMPTRAPRTP